jgi:hypothetical protein
LLLVSCLSSATWGWAISWWQGPLIMGQWRQLWKMSWRRTVSCFHYMKYLLFSGVC